MRSAARRAARTASALLVAALACGACGSVGTGPPADPDPAGLVNPFAGTAARSPDFGTGGGAGNTFPGATLPFGLVQWSPETVPGLLNSPGGYDWADATIRGFSLTHLSGAGCPTLQDVPFLPTTEPVAVAPVRAGTWEIEPRYLAAFSHEAEQAAPGDYRVRLHPGTGREISVELSATTRTGVARLVFPPGHEANLLVNAGGSSMANGDAVVSVDPARAEVSGEVESGQFCFARNRYRVFFAAEFDRPFAAWGTWSRSVLSPGSTSASDRAEKPFHLRPISGIEVPPSVSNGAQAGAWVSFAPGSTVSVRVGVSFTSVEGARANLRAENPGAGVEEVRREARARWNELLGRVSVEGGEERDRRTFATMLYHALLAPNVFSDANGDYAGMDGVVRRADGWVPHANFSGWDVYRSQVALLSIVDPGRAADVMQSLVANARESGWLPKWPVAAGHTDVMVGDPAAPAIATAHAFGARGFDAPAALEAMVKGATEVGRSPNADYVERQGLEDYLRLGWVPHDESASNGGATSIFGSTDAVWGSAATTLEYAVADFAIARLAAALGDRRRCGEFLGRSASWRNLWEPAAASVVPRFRDGRFLAPFLPESMEGFVEGSGAQYAWMIPHDQAGLVAAMGGASEARLRLEDFFTELDAGPSSRFAYLGNEPSSLAPWTWAWLGEPQRARETVRRAILGLFDDGPAGHPGNDDLGQMSAWWVFGALGLYPAIPGTDVLVLGSPLFEAATLRLAGGRTLRVVGRGAGRERPYATRIRLDGRDLERSWVSFSELSRGATLEFELAATAPPGPGPATDPPPSFPPAGATTTCDPG